MIESFIQDLRYAIRTLRHSPGFTAVAIASLALGIGANTAIFTVVNAVLLGALPYRDPGRLAIVWTVPPHRPDSLDGVSVAQYAFWKKANRSFESMGAIDSGYTVNLGAARDASAERIDGHRASAAIFRTLAVSPALGRYYTEDEDQPGANPVAVIGHRLWQRRFRSDPRVVGKTLELDGVETTIVGVMPAGFGLLDSGEPDFFIPLAFTNSLLQGRQHWISVAARLRPGVGMERAQAEMEALFAAFARTHPDRDKGWGVRLQPVREASVGWMRRTLLVLQGAVGFVLLIACANIAGLLLARASSRRREIAIRTALGGGRWRIVRQMLTESLLLAVCGGVAGIMLAYAGLRPLIAISPDWFPFLQTVTIDIRVLVFTAGVSVATGLLFGIVPAFQSARPEVTDSLKEGGRGSGAGQARQRIRGALVTLEIAMSLVLLIGAGLMIDSFMRLQSIDYGCDPKGLLTFQVRLPKARFVKEAGTSGGFQLVDINPAVPVFFDSVFGRVSGIPGVESAAGTNYLPLRGGPERAFTIEGRPIAAESDTEAQVAAFFPVTPNYFTTMKIPLLRGRDFTARDNAASPWVVTISQLMAKRCWPGEDPIGKRLTFTDAAPGERPRAVIGVVGDVRRFRRQRDLQPAVYVPHEQQVLHTQGRFSDSLVLMSFVLRVPGDPLRLVPALRKAVAEVDRNQPVFNLRTEEQTLELQVQDSRYYMLLLAVFAGVAIVLAAVGIYGLMTYSVARRTQEIGIRMALGATAASVLRMVLRQGAWLIGMGLTASLALTRLIENQLWGVKATDPNVYLIISALLAVIAAAACIVPGRRAARVDPAVALRHE